MLDTTTISKIEISFAQYEHSTKPISQQNQKRSHIINIVLESSIQLNLVVLLKNIYLNNKQKKIRKPSRVKFSKKENFTQLKINGIFCANFSQKEKNAQRQNYLHSIFSGNALICEAVECFCPVALKKYLNHIFENTI